MFYQINDWLKKPYPFPATAKAKIIISLGFGIFIFLFLLLFKPFDFSLLEGKVLYFALGYGVITAVMMLVNLFLLPLLFPKFFKTSDWVIYKMILFVIWLLLLISMANWFFSVINFDSKNIEGHNFSFFLLVTVLVGFFPLLLYLFISERVKTKQYKNIATNILENKKEIRKTETDKNNETQLITLVGDNKKEEFQVTLQDLLFINSEKNYASVFYLVKNEVKEYLLRVTLTKIEEQTNKHKSIVRCHKSFIVNTNRVVKIQGNARSLLLKINNPCDSKNNFLIPVSRNFPSELLFTLIN